MLYVQFDTVVADAASRWSPPTGAALLVRARRIDDVLDGLELRRAEPAVLVMRYALAFALGVESVAASTWRARGLDLARGFALAVGRRRPGREHGSDGRWPLGLAAFARGDELRRWLGAHGVAARSDGSDLAVAGEGEAARVAAEAARAAWSGTLASDDPYMELTARFGLDAARPLGGLWAAACRRGARFQVEMVAALPGVPPLHVIARDPPLDVEEVIPPDRAPPIALRVGAARPVEEKSGPPSWDEPGPCDCGVPPDECAMRRFRLTPRAGAPESELPGADSFRQLSASLVDLHRASSSLVDGVRAGDRVLVARSPESFAALRPGDAVLDEQGVARPLAPGERRDGIAGAILQPLPWPTVGAAGAFRRTFSGLW